MRATHQLTLRCKRIPAPPNPDDLRLKAQHFFNNSLAANTRCTYKIGQQRFKTFCQAINARTLPASEATVTLFITYLATENISYKTIKVYLSVVRHMHISAGMFSEFGQHFTPCLQLTLKGIQCSQALSHPPRPRLPITLQLLQNIYAQLSQQPQSCNNILTCCEFTTPSDTQYDKDCHLSIDDISINSRDNPQLLKVTLKQSKIDTFRVGVDLYLKATEATICPVRGLLPYLALRAHHKESLFILEDGKYLTRQRLCTLLDSLLIKLRIDIHNYNTHSFP